MKQMSLPLTEPKPKKIVFASRKHGRAAGVTTEPVGLAVMPPVKSWHRVVPPWCGGVDPTWKPLTPTGEQENVGNCPHFSTVHHEPRRKDRSNAKANQDAVTRNYREHKRQALVDPETRERIAAAEADRLKRERRQSEFDRLERERKRRLGVIN